MADYQSTVEIRANTTQLERKMKGVQKSLAATNSAVVKTQSSFSKLGSNMSRSLGKVNAAIEKSRLKLVGLGVAIGGVTAKGINDFKKYEASLLQIGTLGVKNLKQVESSVNALTKAHGVDSQQALKGYYDIVSAGASEGAQAMGQLEAASKLAAAGNTNLAGAIDILTTGVNVFGDNGETAESVTDKLFTTVKLGKTTVEELGRSFGLVAATADAAGISLGETGAALAVMTAGGLRTATAVTGLKAALSNVIKVTPKAEKAAKRLGIEFNQAALAEKGFVEFFKEIKDKTGGSVTELGKLFDSVEAINAVATITSDTGIVKLDQAFQQMGKSTGTVNKEFKKVEKGIGVQLQKLTASIGEFSRVIGKALVPGTIELIKIAQPMLEFFTKIIEVNPELVKLTTKIGSFALALGLLGLGPTAALGALALAFKKFGKHYGVFEDGAAAFTKVAKDLNRFKATVSDIASEVQDVFSNMLQKPIENIKKGISTINEVFYKMYMYLVGGSVVPDLADGILESFNNISKYFSNLVTDISSQGEDLGEAISAPFSESLLDKATGAWEENASKIQNISETLTTSLHNRYIGLSTQLGVLWDVISEGASRLLENFKEVRTEVKRFTDSISTAIQNNRALIDRIGAGFKNLNLGALSIPVTAAFNWDAVKQGIGEIATALKAGDIQKALKVLAGSADFYLSNFITTLSTLFTGAIHIITSDATELANTFGQTFQALEDAIDSVRDEVTGVFNGLILPIQLAIEVVYDFIQLLLELTGIDGESILGSVVAAMLTLKIAVWAVKSAFTNLFVGINKGFGSLSADQLGNIVNVSQAGGIFKIGDKIGQSFQKGFDVAKLAATNAYASIRAGGLKAFVIDKAAVFFAALINGFHILKAKAITAFASMANSFKLFKVQAIALDKQGLFYSAIFGKYGVSTLLGKFTGFMGSVLGTVRSTLVKSSILGTIVEQATIGGAGVLGKVFAKAKAFMLKTTKMLKYGALAAVALFSFSATASEGESTGSAAPDAESGGFSSFFDDFGGLMSIAVITALQALPWGRIFAGAWKGLKGLVPLLSKFLKTRIGLAVIGGLKVVSRLAMRLIGGWPAALLAAFVYIAPALWDMLKWVGSGIWEGLKYAVSGAWVKDLYNLIAANNLEDAIINTADLNDKFKELEHLDLNVPVDIDFDESRIKRAWRDQTGLLATLSNFFTRDKAQESYIEKVMPNKEVEAVSRFWGSELPGYVKNLEKVKFGDIMDQKNLEDSVGKLKELQGLLTQAQANKGILVAGLYEGEGDESIITERLNASESLALAEAQILEITKNIQAESERIHLTTIAEFKKQVEYQEILKERGIFLPKVYKDANAYAKDLAKYDEFLLKFATEEAKYRSEINKHLEKALQYKADLGVSDAEHLKALKQIHDFERKSILKGLATTPSTDTDKALAASDKAYEAAATAHGKLNVLAKEALNAKLITQEAYNQTLLNNQQIYLNKTTLISKDNAKKLLAIREGLQSRLDSMLGQYGEKDANRLFDRANKLKELQKLISEAKQEGVNFSDSQIDSIRTGIISQTLADSSNKAVAYFQSLKDAHSDFSDSALGTLSKERKMLNEHYTVILSDKEVSDKDRLIAQEHFAKESTKIAKKRANVLKQITANLQSYLSGLDRSTASLDIKTLDEGVEKNLATQKLVYENTLQDLKTKHLQHLDSINKTLADDKAAREKAINEANLAYIKNINAQSVAGAKEVARIQERARQAAIQKAISGLNTKATAFKGTNTGLNAGKDAEILSLTEKYEQQFKKGWENNIQLQAMYQRELLAIDTKHYEDVIALKESQIEKERKLLLENGSPFDGIRVGVHDFFNGMKTEAELFARATSDSLSSVKNALMDFAEGKDVDFKDVIKGVLRNFAKAQMESALDGIFKSLATSFGFEELQGAPDGSKDSPYFVNIKSKADNILGNDKGEALGIPSFLDKFKTSFTYDTDVGSEQTQMLAEQDMGFSDVTSAINNNTNSLGGIFENSFSGLGDLFSNGLTGLGDLFSSGLSGLSSLFGGAGGGGIGSFIGGLFGFAEGGEVPEPNGSVGPTDVIPALLTPGEAVLTEKQQGTITDNIEGVTGPISGMAGGMLGAAAPASEDGDGSSAIVAAVNNVSGGVATLEGSVTSGLSSVKEATKAGANQVKAGQAAMQVASKVMQTQAQVKETTETTAQTTVLTGAIAANTAAVISAVTATSMLSGGGLVTNHGVKPLYFNQGGFVPKGTDTIPAMLTPGEMVLNEGQQAALKPSGPVINQTLNITEAMDPKQFQAELVKNNKVVVGLVQQSYNKRGQNGPQGYGK